MQLNIINLIYNSSIAYIGGIIGIALSFFTKIALVKILDPNDLGNFLNFQVYLGFLIYISSLSMNDYIVKNINNLNNDNKYAQIKEIFSITNISTLVTIILFSLYFIIIGNKTIDIFGFIVILICLPIKLKIDQISSYYQSMGNLNIKVLYVDLFSQISFFIAIIFSLFKNIKCSNCIYIYYLIPLIIIICILKYKLIKIKPSNFNKTNKKEIYKFVLPLYLAGILSYPLQLIPIYLAKEYSPSLSAYFGLAISLSGLIYLGMSVVEAAGFAINSNLASKNQIKKINEYYKFTTKWMGLICSIIFCPMFLTPELIINTIFNSEYAEVAKILPSLAIITLINVMGGPTENIIKAFNNTKIILITRFTVGVVSLLFGYILIKIWGLWGAVYVTAIANIITIIIYNLYIYIGYKIQPFNKNYIYTLSIIIGSTYITSELNKILFKNNNGIIEILCLMLIYILTLLVSIYLLPIITKFDKMVILRIIRKNKNYKII